VVGVYLELFTYHHPKGDQTIHRRKTNDLGGIRRVAVEVPDAVAAHAFIRFQQQAYGKRGLNIEIVGKAWRWNGKSRLASWWTPSEQYAVYSRNGHLPLLLSNTPVFIEATGDYAVPPSTARFSEAQTTRRRPGRIGSSFRKPRVTFPNPNGTAALSSFFQAPDAQSYEGGAQ
jgi:hypothetical protein